MESPIEAFAGAAREYCQWFEGSGHDLPAARRLLLTLMLRVAELPPPYWPNDVEEPPRRTHEDWQRAHRHAADFPIQYYSSVFDPLDMEATGEPTIGDAHDDLADIYGDIAHGLAALDQGSPELAAALWRQSYGFHWGQHAASLLKVVDAASRRQD